MNNNYNKFNVIILSAGYKIYSVLLWSKCKHLSVTTFFEGGLLLAVLGEAPS